MKKIVIKATLAILNECNGNSIGEEALFTFVNNKLDAMAVSTDSLKTHLQHCKSKGWIDYRVDDFGETKWFISDAGKVLVMS